MKRNPVLSLTFGLALAAAGLVFAVSRPAAAADVGKEMAAAEKHAGYAASAGEVKMVHAHLHHVINCLVGPKGEGFDAKQLNPCKGLGDGIIPGTTDAAKKEMLESVAAKAEAGLKIDDLSAAQKQAAEVASMLKAAM